MSTEPVRQVKRQLELFLEDGERNRIIVCLALLDEATEQSASRYAADWTRVADAALEVYTEEGVRVWMTHKNSMLGDRSPEELIKSGETQRVLDYIDFLAEGNFA